MPCKNFNSMEVYINSYKNQLVKVFFKEAIDPINLIQLIIPASHQKTISIHFDSRPSWKIVLGDFIDFHLLILMTWSRSTWLLLIEKLKNDWNDSTFLLKTIQTVPFVVLHSLEKRRSFIGCNMHFRAFIFGSRLYALC